MSEASRSMETVPLLQRPHGYLFVRTSRHPRYPIHDCELRLQSGGRAFTLTCQIFDIQRERRRYSLFLFADEVKTRPIYFTVVCYVDGFGDSVQEDLVCLIDQRWGVMRKLLVRVCHVLIHRALINDCAPFKADNKTPETEWYLPINKNAAELIEHQAKISLKALVPAIVSLSP